MFYLHLRLGNKKAKLVEKIFKVPRKTVQNWVANKNLVFKWLSFATNLTIEDIISNIPEEFQEYYSDMYSKAKDTYFEIHITNINLKPYWKKVNNLPKYITQNKEELVQKIRGNTNYLSNKVKRKSNCIRFNKYHYVQEYILSLLNMHWKESKLSLTILY